jgi:NADH dehydrogenase (ubiquinone) 1 alpha subcomplex subunit 13
MASKPIVRSFQDMPPPGGYPKIPTRKDLRPRGPSGFAIWGGLFLASAFGFWSLSRTSYEQRMGNKENREARMAILPFLKAEEDSRLLQVINKERTQTIPSI